MTPPYIFRYHNTALSDNHYRNHKNRSRRRTDHNDQPERKYKYEDSTYGETVYDYESDHTGRSYSRTPSKHYHDNGNHSSHRNPQGHLHSNGNHSSHLNRQGHLLDNSNHSSHWNHQSHLHSNGNHKPYIPEPHMKNEVSPQEFVVRELHPTNPGLNSEPRVYFLDKRLRKDTSTHCGCHACPQKSSKKIPTMHYDELKCPHCAAYAQPSHDEVIAYPWTAQSYRPHRRFVPAGSVPPQQPSTKLPSLANGSLTSKPQSTTSDSQSTTTSTSRSSYISKSESTEASRRIARAKNPANGTGKENSSLGAPPRPLFRHLNNNLSRSDVRTDYSQFSKQSYMRPALSTLLEDGGDIDDEIKPTDSISNVSVPVLRVRSTDLIPNYRSHRQARPEARVDENYTREKLFRSLENSSPRPAKDTASEISRMLKGEYYDRRNGRTYTYNLSYAPGKIDGTRLPKT